MWRRVELVGGELAFEIGEQFRIARRIGGPQVVRLVNDAAPQQPEPDAVHDGFGEVRIAGRGEPCRQLAARIFLRAHLDGGAGFREPRLYNRARSRVLQIRAEVRIDDLFLPFLGGFVIHAGEECGEAQVVIERPALLRMRVAAGAAEAFSHEDQGGGFG